jgi:hypothetical protein
VALLQSLWDMGLTRSTVLSSGMKLFPAITTSNMDTTQMVRTSDPIPYVVWTSDTEADRVFADLIISLLEEVVFYKDGKEQKRYSKQSFTHYNPKWVTQENID